MSNHISTPSTPQVNGAVLGKFKRKQKSKSTGRKNFTLYLICEFLSIAYSAVTREESVQSMSLGNSNNSSGHAESSPILTQQQQSPAVTSTAQVSAPPPPQQQQQPALSREAAVPVVVPSKLNSSASVDSTGTVASSISTAPSPLPSAATPPSSAAASSLPLVNGPSNKSGAESISLRAMAQHAVDQQVVQPAVPTSDPTANLHYSENNINNNNNPGVVGSGRTGGSSSGQLSAPTSLVPPPPAPTGEAHIPPLLGVAPLGPVALSKEQQVRAFLSRHFGYGTSTIFIPDFPDPAPVTGGRVLPHAASIGL